MEKLRHAVSSSPNRQNKDSVSSSQVTENDRPVTWAKQSLIPGPGPTPSSSTSHTDCLTITSRLLYIIILLYIIAGSPDDTLLAIAAGGNMVESSSPSQCLENNIWVI